RRSSDLRRCGLPGGRIPVVVGVDLIRGVAEVLALDRMGAVLLRRAQIVERAGVCLDLVPSTAEQMMDGKAGDPTSQIPKGEVDHTHDVLGDLGSQQPLPDLLSLHWILTLTGEQGSHELRYQCLLRCQEAVLVAMEVTAEVVALDSLVGGDLREGLEHLLLGMRLAVGESVDERLERDDFDSGDFHRWSFSDATVTGRRSEPHSRESLLVDGWTKDGWTSLPVKFRTSTSRTWYPLMCETFHGGGVRRWARCGRVGGPLHRRTVRSGSASLAQAGGCRGSRREVDMGATSS